jgi:hypothetical protein
MLISEEFNLLSVGHGAPTALIDCAIMPKTIMYAVIAFKKFTLKPIELIG